jgi:hypothetical protein
MCMAHDMPSHHLSILQGFIPNDIVLHTIALAHIAMLIPYTNSNAIADTGRPCVGTTSTEWEADIRSTHLSSTKFAATKHIQISIEGDDHKQCNKELVQRRTF